MRTAAPITPAFRHSPDKELIPRVLLRAMLGLVLATIAIVGYASLTDRPTVAQPKPADVVFERSLILEGAGAKAVVLRDADGELIAALGHGGFITVIQNGLARARLVHGVQADLPVRLVSYANGRLTLHDDLTGWSVELGSFGGDNRASFERLMQD